MRGADPAPSDDGATRAPEAGPRSSVGGSLPLTPGYAIVTELARGGMGVVFTARDKTLGREVAIKTLLPGSAGNATAVRRFVIEARVTARLSHPGIPPVFALGSMADGRPFLAMKLIKGRTLAAVLAARANRPAGPDDGLERTALQAPGLLHVFEQICQAVGYAHSHEVIHRDLKPANVMLGAFGEVQVMDWGLAREIGPGCGTGTHAPLVPSDAPDLGSEDTGIRAADDTEQSRLGEALGTPAFMPPEQARGEWDRVDARADVFALGGILCVILTGQAPYTGGTVLDVVRRAVTGDLRDAFDRLDACGADPGLVVLAKWCLAPNPEERLPNAAAVAAALQAHWFDTEGRLKYAARTRAAAAVRLAERRAHAAATAAVRQAAEERLREAARQAEARRVEEARRHWTLTALVVLAILFFSCLYQHFR
jgi:serine/threonine protein kinase